jgi:nicotinamidase-related amidase
MPRVNAQPYAYEFDPAKTAVIMIDMQRDFILPGGFGETLGNNVGLLAAIVPTAKKLLDTCRAAGMTIIHTKECHRPDMADCPPAKLTRGNPTLRIGDKAAMGRILIDGEVGSDFVPELAPQAGDIVLTKPGKGAFYATSLGDILRLKGITHLLFGGVTTEVCVQTTMREANDRGYECLLVEDATESYFPEFKAATVAMVRAQGGIVGWTATADQVLTALG